MELRKSSSESNNKTPVLIDGSEGEGGGQILRTSLTLSMITGRPVRLTNIRAGRRKPGLMRQHLACVKAAAEISKASFEGASLTSTQLEFTPGQVQAGSYEFGVGSAGSTSLVLQTVFPALATCDEASSVRVTGGTHNPLAPSFDFLQQVYAPHVVQFGFNLEIELERYGFAPAGGGSIVASVEPARKLTGLRLVERLGKPKYSARVLLSQLEKSIATRELKTACRRLPIDEEQAMVEMVESSGPGNVILLSVEYDNCRELVCESGQVGVKAERVARAATNELRKYIASSAPVGEHLADQLMLPAALAAMNGEQSTLSLQTWSSHCETHRTVIEQFLGVRFDKQDHDDRVELSILPA